MLWTTKQKQDEDWSPVFLICSPAGPSLIYFPLWALLCDFHFVNGYSLIFTCRKILENTFFHVGKHIALSCSLTLWHLLPLSIIFCSWNVFKVIITPALYLGYTVKKGYSLPTGILAPYLSFSRSSEQVTAWGLIGIETLLGLVLPP